jgi:Flp pilus assembly pilin Flp
LRQYITWIVVLMYKPLIRSLFGCTKAATALEYAFVASLISIAIYAAVSTIGTQLTSVFSTVAASF